jgi:hypothetical protein
MQNAVGGERLPELVSGLTPSVVHGVALQAHRVYAGEGLDELQRFNARLVTCAEDEAALDFDEAVALGLRFRAGESAALQRRALELARTFRVASGFGAQSARPLRLLAVVAPGDFMTNTPLDFITQHLDVQLDLLFVVPGQDLPCAVPDHDVAFFAVGESDEAGWRRLDALYRAWKRPALNRPAQIARLARDTVADGLAQVPGICSPKAIRLERVALLAHLDGSAPVALLRDEVAIIRPSHSHAGHDLEKIGSDADLVAYLSRVGDDAFFVTRFVDYRGTDGLHRKYRVVFIDGAPFLCHMASSPHWMVHYLNAGMDEHAERREEEAQAMAEFDGGFARRHASAFDALNAWMGLDYFQIDCAETQDGRLLVFEVDVAAIVHLMDPPDLFPYKGPQMQRVFRAFEGMLRKRVAQGLCP